VSSDDSVRALLAVLIDVDPGRIGPGCCQRPSGRSRPPTATGSSMPHPRGTRVAVDLDGQRHLGLVQYPVLDRNGSAIRLAARTWMVAFGNL
jgi:hypothetical protein